MDRGDIIAALIGAVVLIAAVIYVLYAKIRTSERRETEYLVTRLFRPALRASNRQTFFLANHRRNPPQVRPDGRDGPDSSGAYEVR